MRKYFFLYKSERLLLIIFAIVTLVLYASTVAITFMEGTVINALIEAEHISHIFVPVFTLVGLFIIYFISIFLNLYLKGYIEQKLVYKFKQHIIDHMQKISIIRYKKFEYAYLAKRIEDDTTQLVSFFLLSFASMFFRFLQLLAIAIIIFTIDVNVFITMFVGIVIYFLIYRFHKDKMFERSKRLREETSLFFGDYTGQLQHLENIVIVANLEKEREGLKNRFNIFLKAFVKDHLIKLSNTYLQNATLSFLSISIWIVGGIGVINGTNTLGMVMASVFYIQLALVALRYYSTLGEQYQSAKAALVRIDELMAIPQNKEGELQLGGMSSISADVSFAIEDRQILKNQLLNAKKGEAIAITGKNGAGKTTLLKLVIGVLKSEGSSVVINGEYDIKELDSFYLRNEALAYVPQKVNFRDSAVCEVFRDIAEYKSLEEFLGLFGSKNIPFTDLHSILQDSWDKDVNDMSGGGRQLISIIYNAMKPSDVFILDEPTSNLDKNVIAWFKKLIISVKKDKILFVITHEESILDIFDKIIKL